MIQQLSNRKAKAPGREQRARNPGSATCTGVPRLSEADLIVKCFEGEQYPYGRLQFKIAIRLKETKNPYLKTLFGDVKCTFGDVSA
jgi:hypothetical protein